MTPTDIKVPRKQTAGWITRALANVPKDGQWYKLRSMAISSAEQTARALNRPSAGKGEWEWGYRLSSDGNNQLVSELWVRWS